MEHARCEAAMKLPAEAELELSVSAFPFSFSPGEYFDTCRWVRTML